MALGGGEAAPRTDGHPEQVTVEVGTLPSGFYVADDGPGIPEDRREAVFERRVSTGEGERGGARFEIRTGA